MEGAKGRTLKIGQMELKFLVDETESAGRMVMFEFAVPAKARVPAAHHHVEADETVYGLEGTLTTTIDGVKHEITPGASAFIPRGSVHIHENLHDGTARVLSILSPGTIGRRYFEEIAQTVNVPGKPDLAAVKTIMLRHGLVPA